ncbi:helix-turn-helix domain-containing protein [Shewanella oncorhynchi]|uniref:helix-turn-helix domain-containing protein n=1 Tax=Shewanella TaxID=22 RepID=UPI0021DB3F45|nr:MULTISPECIES: helix-turn-helix domain-containing protein [unclassified Shewanella]MCU7999803.1 helix-turn-helix domain-containing protein [Shewanella sp. SM95]MCU8004396.1 helix-turn-helix domain-containing protein [Shewanella sp. SM96]MCU8018649.1 helix-turn-helix domain-containing protein [Shewanella sp. SM72]MCU8020947.1 helix-turn-helix domain-containing protein [Shewanella sp. SM78]MCU8040434.1 helix-turn-helix domain-containing protein [Shewanella sp. SM69]
MNNRIVSQINEPDGSDWHRADIIAALKKRGLSVRQLSRDAGLSENTLANALRSPWPKGEEIIATAIGMTPEHVWPSRYRSVRAASVFVCG